MVFYFALWLVLPREIFKSCPNALRKPAWAASTSASAAFTFLSALSIVFSCFESLLLFRLESLPLDCPGFDCSPVTISGAGLALKGCGFPSSSSYNGAFISLMTSIMVAHECRVSFPFICKDRLCPLECFDPQMQQKLIECAGFLRNSRIAPLYPRTFFSSE
ncbi:hypothetical protein B0O80DRAFT_133503 [Mortierella sp. GBAus27b]|nr:hypothetical protein B0O80DRAFT_133503 [Mortierella sp. GBAus27b]